MTNNKMCWSDLPPELFGLIVIKLHFVDQVRVLAVCKSWNDSKNYVTCSDTLPFVISTQKPTDTHSFMFNLFDPYSRQAYRVPNYINNLLFSDDVCPLATKGGWLFIAGDQSKPFCYNPFSNDYVDLNFPLVECKGMRAAISVLSGDVEVFTLTTLEGCVKFETYSRSRGLTSAWMAEIDEVELFCSVVYVKGIVYGVTCDGKLYRYRLEYGSWDVLTTETETVGDTMRDGWLMEMNGDLIMVSLDMFPYDYFWSIFKFDWSKMRWDFVDTRFGSYAMYISGDVAFCTPLADRNGKKLQGCKLFYHSDDTGFKCFPNDDDAETQMKPSEEYGWINGPAPCQFSFIEPPYIWKLCNQIIVALGPVRQLD